MTILSCQTIKQLGTVQNMIDNYGKSYPKDSVILWLLNEIFYLKFKIIRNEKNEIK